MAKKWDVPEFYSRSGRKADAPITTSGGTIAGSANSRHSASSVAGGNADEPARHCPVRGRAPWGPPALPSGGQLVPCWRPCNRLRRPPPATI